MSEEEAKNKKGISLAEGLKMRSDSIIEKSDPNYIPKDIWTHYNKG